MRLWLSSLLIVATLLARTPDDPIAEATSLDQQAAALYQQGRCTEPLYQRALPIREQGSDPTTSMSLPA